MKPNSKIIAVLLLTIVGCTTEQSERVTPTEQGESNAWGVIILRINGTPVPQAEWTKVEKDLFASEDFQKKLSDLESGTTWTPEPGKFPYTWVLSDWDWTNMNVIIRRKVAPAN